MNNQTLQNRIPVTPQNETPHQDRRQWLWLLALGGLFLLGAASELYTRGLDPLDVVSTLFTGAISVVDPETAFPSIDPFTNLLGLIAVLRNVIPSLVMFAVALWLTTHFLQTVHGLGSRQEAQKYLLLSLIGWGKHKVDDPVTVVKGGEVLGGWHQTRVRVGGSGSLKVHNDSAALLERAGVLTRSLGPGFYPLQRFEKVRAVVDLRPRWHKVNVGGLSREGIPVDCQVEVNYQVHNEGKGLYPASADMPYAWSDEAIFKALTAQRMKEFGQIEHQDWANRPPGDAQGALRGLMAQRPLDQLIQPLGKDSTEESPRQALQAELESNLRKGVAGYGIKILGVNMDNIKLRDPVTQQWIDTWKAEWTKRQRNELTVGKIERIRKLNKAKAKAQKEMTLALINAFQTPAGLGKPISSKVVVWRFVQVVQRMAAGRGYVDTDVFNILRDLRRMIGPDSEDMSQLDVRPEETPE